MKKLIFGIILLFLNLILIIVGIAFLIATHYLNYNSIVEVMWIIGLIGVGAGIGTLLTFFGALLLVEGLK